VAGDQVFVANPRVVTRPLELGIPLVVPRIELSTDALDHVVLVPFNSFDCATVPQTEPGTFLTAE